MSSQSDGAVRRRVGAPASLPFQFTLRQLFAALSWVALYFGLLRLDGATDSVISPIIVVPWAMVGLFLGWGETYARVTCVFGALAGMLVVDLEFSRTDATLLEHLSIWPLAALVGAFFGGAYGAVLDSRRPWIGWCGLAIFFIYLFRFLILAVRC